MRFLRKLTFFKRILCYLVTVCYCQSVEEIDTIALVQKSASNHQYLARNEEVNSVAGLVNGIVTGLVK